MFENLSWCRRIVQMILRASQKEKLVATGGRAPVSQTSEGIDRLRQVFFENDCMTQSSELASVMDATQLTSLLVCSPLREPNFKRAEAYEGAEWIADLEQGSNQVRELQRREAEEKMKFLKEEHEMRLAERTKILEKELVDRLEKEHIRFK